MIRPARRTFSPALSRRFSALGALCAGLILIPLGLGAQAEPIPVPSAGAGGEGDSTADRPGASDPLAELVEEALRANPEIHRARSLEQAQQARIPQAGTLPDPTLSAGLMDLPVPDMDLSAEGMTMFSIQVGQRFPAPGVRGAREERARALADADAARTERVRWSVATRLQEAYFALLEVEEAVMVHHRTHAALEAYARSAESSYAQGIVPQQDILRAHAELVRIEDHLVELRERRGRALAQVNALLGRPSRTPVQLSVPPRVEALLGAEPDAGFLTSHLTDVELGEAFPTLAELQEEALRRRPEIEEARHRSKAARSAVREARSERWPGISVTGGYGLRSGRRDMLSLGVSVELPVFRGRKQDQAVLEAEHLLGADERAQEVSALDVEREVAEAHAELVRLREQILLLDEGIVPQARATVTSAAAAYGTGEGSFVGLMEAQSVLYRYEIERAHLVADMGRKLVRLEMAVGMELHPEENR